MPSQSSVLVLGESPCGSPPVAIREVVIPNPTPLQTALGVGSTLSGIYGNIMGPYRTRTN